MKKIKIIFIPLLISFISLFYMYKTYHFTLNEKEAVIYIEDGFNLTDISRELVENNVIRWDKYFITYTKLKGLETKIKAGKYTVPAKNSMEELLEILQNPRQDQIVITIPEGYSLFQIASKLENSYPIQIEKFLNTGLNVLKNNRILEERGDVFYQLEGFLFPDTYFLPVDASEEEIINIMFRQFLRIFSEESILRAKELGLSINEVVTIASLIEKEASNDDERKRIAGVIYNRLRLGMPLQIDATVIYAHTQGKENISRVTYKDLKIESKYNTYLLKKLPPGPIASAGKASIEAALFPEENDYLYYVLGEDGHVFSENYNEHLKNVEKFRIKQRRW